jgi:hypothetical protein
MAVAQWQQYMAVAVHGSMAVSQWQQCQWQYMAAPAPAVAVSQWQWQWQFMAVAAGHSAYLAVTPRVRRPQHRVNLLRSQRQVAPAVALDAFGKLGAAGGGVAVAGWQWWQSKEDIKAVRMVPVRKWQWQYWPRYCGCNVTMKKWQKWQVWQRRGGGGGTGGSGWVRVVSIERGDQGGSNGGS